MWEMVSSRPITGTIGLGTPSGMKLRRYFLAPFQRTPSTCVKTTLKTARTSVTESWDVTA